MEKFHDSFTDFPYVVASNQTMKDKLFKKGGKSTNGKKTKKNHALQKRQKGFFTLCCGRQES